jgi:O-antigen/teichoic acid export membrane protein
VFGCGKFEVTIVPENRSRLNPLRGHGFVQGMSQRAGQKSYTLVSATTSHAARQQVHPVLRDLLVTAAASLATFVAGLALISIFGRLLGATLLAEYLLLRRVAAWLQPLAHLGLGVALPRYVAYSTQRSPVSRLGYFVAGTVCIALFGSILGIVLSVARRPLSRILFGDAEFSPLMLPLFLLLLAGAVQVAVYGFYRGCLAMKRAGAISLCAAIAPLISAAALFRSRSVALIVSAMACSVIAVTLVLAIPILRTLNLHRRSLRDIPARARELLKYGVSRVPGDLSNGALLAVGPVVASHYMPVSHVSYLLVAISMLTAASLSTDPLGLVFLSKISMMLAQDRLNDVRTYLSHLISATVDLSIFFTLQLIVFVDVLVRAWIGASFLEGISIIRLVIIGVPFYLFFTGLRSAVDAGSLRPLNARNIVVSLVALSIMVALSTQVVPRELLLHAIAISLVLTFMLLAYATRLSLANLYDVRVRWKESGISVFWATILGALGFVYHQSSQGTLLHLAALELIFTLAFLGACFYSGVRWARLLSAMVFRHEVDLETANQLVTSPIRMPDENASSLHS